MTLQEVCLQLGKSESTIKQNFKRTQDTLAKKGIILMKKGRGDNVVYTIQYENKE